MTPLRAALVSLLSLILAGCQSAAYLGHLGKGQWQMLSRRQPVERLLRDPATPPALSARLQNLQGIRAFAAGLGLPVKGQFDTYVDIHRPYALWSVSATPELSLQAKSWCWWFVGCLAYRNYFAEAPAEAFAAGLQDQGYDTHIGKVAAYSTLGWFRDSMLSSQMARREPDLAELVFHELAHQVVYARNDPVFNESFAEVVAHEALRRYLVGRPEDLKAVVLRLQRQHQFAELIQPYRQELHRLYTSPVSPEEKRLGKQRILDSLREAHEQLKRETWDGYAGYDAWFAGLNNARLNSVAVYHDLVPALDALLASVSFDLPRFFEHCRRLQDLPKAERYRILSYSQSQVELQHD